MQQPELKKKYPVSPIWILPLVAFCIGGWLLYTNYRDAGIDIVIHFATADGITAGKTKVIYKGIPVGLVKKVEIADDLKGVNLLVEMDKKTRPGLVEDTNFWIVRPEISAGRITGLETLFSGSYIAVKKGNSSLQTRRFEGLNTPPPLNTDTPGLHLTLKTPSLYSLQRGSRVYSKNLKIGLVEDFKLDKDGMITLKVLIKPEYRHLIKKDTRFWNASGLSVTGNLQTGLTVNVESLAALIYGGISCATPKAVKDSPPAEPGSTYRLYRDFEDAEYGITMTLQLATGAGIIEGKTKVVYRGLKAGVVKKLDINRDTFHTVTATILLDPRAEVILHEKTRFWVIRPQISIEGIKNLGTLLSGAYITFQAGDGKFRNHFIVETNPMPIPTLRPGTNFTLTARDSGSLTIGTSVFYRKLVVGEITDIVLAEDGKHVRTTILIYEPYDRLVQDDSIFWNVSGIQVNGSLSNFKINLSSMRAMLAGGITFITPKLGEAGAKPKSRNEFTLYESYHDAAGREAALQPRGLSLRIRTDKAAPVGVDSPILFHNLKIGKVMDVRLSGHSSHIEMTILIFNQFRHLINGSSRFYNFSGIKASANLQGITLESGPLKSIIDGGLALYNPDKKTPFDGKKMFPLYNNREEARYGDGLTLTLHLSSGNGIRLHTPIRYQGIIIGRITAMDFDKGLKEIIARAKVRADTNSLFRNGSTLALVKPQMTLGGIRNLDTILGGPYLRLDPGDGDSRTEFVIVDSSQAMPGNLPGLNLVLETPRRGSLKPGSPIYYRQVPVGRVTFVKLASTGQKVLVHALIKPEYAHIIHRGTRFWNVSGITVSGGVFSGIRMQTQSLEAIVQGGISLATPEGETMGPPARDGDHFLLAARAEEAWQTWQPDLLHPWNREVQKSAETTVDEESGDEAL